MDRLSYPSNVGGNIDTEALELQRHSAAIPIQLVILRNWYSYAGSLRRCERTSEQSPPLRARGNNVKCRRQERDERTKTCDYQAIICFPHMFSAEHHSTSFIVLAVTFYVLDAMPHHLFTFIPYPLRRWEILRTKFHGERPISKE